VSSKRPRTNGCSRWSPTRSNFTTRPSTPNLRFLADLITKKISAEPYDYALLDQLGAEASQIGETIIARLKDVETGVKASIESVNQEGQAGHGQGQDVHAGGYAAGVLLALLLGFVSARNITRPIKQVVELAQQMSDGDFTHNLKTDQKDEIGQLVLP
jgi:methyl-accepting chemotaxis protein